MFLPAWCRTTVSWTLLLKSTPLTLTPPLTGGSNTGVRGKVPRCSSPSTLLSPRHLNVSLPQETRNGGALYAVVYVHKAGVSPLEDGREVHYAAPLTTSIIPSQEERGTQKVNDSADLQISCGIFSPKFTVDLDDKPAVCDSTRGRFLFLIGDLICPSP